MFLCGAACGPAYRYTRTAEATPASKTLDCDFRVTASLPEGGGYAEIGVFELGSDSSHRIEDFKKKIHDQVCTAGGDLVVAEINGFGYYVRGIVLKKTGAQATAQ